MVAPPPLKEDGDGTSTPLKEDGDGTSTLLRNMGGCTSTSQGRWGWHIHLLNNMRHLQSHKGDGYATFTLLSN